MCGRYRLRRHDLVRAVFEALRNSAFDEFSQLDIRWWNIAPSLNVPVVRMHDTGGRIIALAQWGFIPAWAKELPKARPINAKAETVSTNGVFRSSFKSRRCLIPADGFYEWEGTKPPRQPYFIHLKNDALFAFAGLWDRWKPGPDAAPIETFTIITTSPNDITSKIHNRMPVIVPQKDYARWLAPGDDVSDILQPYPAEEMDAYAITSAINKPQNDGPDLIRAAVDTKGLFDL